MGNKIRCTESCFECKYPDCICTNVYPTYWEKEFEARQREIRNEKKKAAGGSGAPAQAALLSIRLR